MSQTFSSLDPIATFMCYPQRENVEMDVLALKIAALFHLNMSEVEDEILFYSIVQAVLEVVMKHLSNTGKNSVYIGSGRNGK